MPKNYGFSPELEKQHRDEQNDWVFGGLSVPCIADIPPEERVNFLPKGERQNIGDEKMDCASRGPLNILEAKFTWLITENKISPENKKWLQDNGYILTNAASESYIEFSDRFIAILSNTTRSGNSLKAPLDAIRKYGLVPKSLFPQVSTFNEYYDTSKITPQMRNLGQAFVARFPISYEVVYPIHYEELLKEDLVDVAGYAWPPEVNGEYPAVSFPFNHCFVLFNDPKYNVFDNYTDSSNTFIKKLASNYNLLDYGYRVYISQENIVEELSLLASLRDVLLRLLALFKTPSMPDLPVPPVPAIISPAPVELPRIKIYQAAMNSLGKDVAPLENEYGCAEAVSGIIHSVFPDFPGEILSTTTLFVLLKDSKNGFKLTDKPSAGNIIISPTGMGNGTIPNGHTGIFDLSGAIMSNDSATGKFLKNLTIDEWVARYRKLGGYPIYFFEKV